jgi:hypothetical protein
MCAGNGQAVVNHYFPPTSVEVQSHNVLSIGRCDWFAKMYIKRVEFVCEHLSALEKMA